MNFRFFRTKMPSTRKADYYLGCLSGAVFIDFNLTDDSLVYLRRISFDGYGCCNLDEYSNCLSRHDSEDFLREMGKEELKEGIIEDLVMKSIKSNEKYIWKDALRQYDLI